MPARCHLMWFDSQLITYTAGCCIGSDSNLPVYTLHGTPTSVGYLLVSQSAPDLRALVVLLTGSNWQQLAAASNTMSVNLVNRLAIWMPPAATVKIADRMVILPRHISRVILCYTCS